VGYGFDLVRLPSGVDRNEAYKRMLKQQEESFQAASRGDRVGLTDPSREEAKQKLAAALLSRHPTLKMFQHDYSRIAMARSIPESEARRRYRNVELSEKQLSIQILLFDDAAGASFSFNGPRKQCGKALRFLWDCLEILESEGGFATYDPQVGKVLDLKSDFEMVRECACGE
jgi:hypothetical protein